ncbi:MAG: DUF2797 domain-containing protein [Xanthomonadales bacterium]|nr:DUF2797 domain-containing protein [Xanthomonadales bacterium]MDH4021113.1 DUF2797 domain-containing protein [Xanthomonadales bacterium]
MLSGPLRKMRVELGNQNHPDEVNYYLLAGQQELSLNPYIGKYLKLEFLGDITCKNCGRKTKKSFSQGFCFPCMRRLAQCDMCILKPETCHFHKGTCREPEWGEKNCFVPHFVYLSNTSGLKVGITRHTQIPTRWVDQGATQASIMFKVNTRRQSGYVETAFKGLIADKTNWRTMLKENQPDMDLLATANELKARFHADMSHCFDNFPADEIEDQCNDVTRIRYPVLEFPEKIKSHNFDKHPLVEGTLMGIKGQYLLFDTGVINIRKFTSYEVQASD